MIDEATRELARLALAEDLGERGDITSEWTVAAEARGRAVNTAREEVVAAGLPLAQAVLERLDDKAVFRPSVEEGAVVAKGGQLATMEASARSILSAERTMLNFLIHLCGVATQSRRFAAAVAGTGAKVVDTRKTLPGLRVWEKRAVALGGCGNHRFGLYDMVLVKNNHLEAAGGVKAALDRVKAANAANVRVEVEVESEADLREAIACRPDVIMLDNQGLDSLRSLVQVARSLWPDVVLEASGRVSLETVRAIAETGVDLISTSALTMGAPPVDLALSLTMGV
jgi:nicotinate-nucleotide pyrophosphorylase (carboxylating)